MCIRDRFKLSYIGKRAMGALEFEPEFNDDAIHESVNMSSLATLASKIYNDRDAAVISPEDSLTMKKLIYLGTSAGGMRPKAVVAYNLETEEFRSGQEDLPENFKQYIIKFKEADDSPTTEIEMVYSEMAKAAGINMVSCFLKEIDGRNHFVTERFDRKDGDKILSQPLAAIMPGADDYMKLCWLAETLKLPQEDKDQIFIRMVFNYVAGISDDYNKNISFIMDKTCLLYTSAPSVSGDMNSSVAVATSVPLALSNSSCAHPSGNLPNTATKSLIYICFFFSTLSGEFAHKRNSLYSPASSSTSLIFFLLTAISVSG